MRFMTSYGRLAGDDKYTTNRERRLRNLNFYSHVLEGSATMQINMGASRRFYVLGGIGYFGFNPKTKLAGVEYELQKYGTEGQYFMPDKKPYSLTAMSFPFGVGYKLFSSKNGYFAIEYVFRKSTTDYIDDASTNYVDPVLLAASNGQVAVQLSDRSIPDIPGFSSPGSIRGDSKDNDNFSFLTFNYVIKFGGGNNGESFGRKTRHRGRMKCPDMSF
jgi:hypothetical protein